MRVSVQNAWYHQKYAIFSDFNQNSNAIVTPKDALKIIILWDDTAEIWYFKRMGLKSVRQWADKSAK